MIFLITVNLVAYNSYACSRKDILDYRKKINANFFLNPEIFNMKNRNDYE